MRTYVPPQAIVEFHTASTLSSATASSENEEKGEGSKTRGGGGNDSGVVAHQQQSNLRGLEMPEDGSTTAVSGKGLSCIVRGLKVRASPPPPAFALHTFDFYITVVLISPFTSGTHLLVFSV